MPGNIRFDGTRDAIQTFTPAKSGRLASVQALVLRQGGGSGVPVTVNLNPMPAVLASASVPASEIPTGAETTITANFDSAPKFLATAARYGIEFPPPPDEQV